MTLPDDVTIKGRDEKEQPTPGGWLESGSGPPRSSRTGEGVGGEAQEWWHKGEICRHRHTDTHYSHIDKRKFSLSLAFLHILSYTHKQAGRQAGRPKSRHTLCRPPPRTPNRYAHRSVPLKASGVIPFSVPGLPCRRSHLSRHWS